MYMPLDGAVQLAEDFVEEGRAGQDTRGLAEETGLTRSLTHHEPAIVEARTILR
jgi:hypothetical protein